MAKNNKQLKKAFKLIKSIDGWVEAWHKSDVDIPLYTFLNMSRKEYAIFVTNPIRWAKIRIDATERKSVPYEF